MSGKYTAPPATVGVAVTSPAVRLHFVVNWPAFPAEIVASSG
jgi:hypothetical protein